jgi:glycosyltransferase involved in cell wall biosynthesis
MPKILLVANTDWYLYNFRISLIRQLRDTGWTPVLVSPPGKYVPFFEQEGLQHIPWQVGRQSVLPWQELPAIHRLKQIYRQQTPDLVHHHTNKAVIYGSMAAHALQIPAINSIPGRGFVFSSTSLKARLIKPITELLFLSVLKPYQRQALIFENRADQAYFIQKRFISAEKTTLIPSVGVDLARFSPTPSCNTLPVVGFIGRMLWGKGVGVFAGAARLLKQRGIPCRMVLVGLPDFDNPDYVPTQALQSWVDEGLLEWWGWQDDMSAVYQKLDILAQPTQYGEGVPTTLIEAAASRRALIATDWPGCREVITHGHTGLLVRPADPADLADKIAELVQNPARRAELAANAWQLVSEKFSTNHVNEETLRVYRQMLGLKA